jgi:hypothetical protein
MDIKLAVEFVQEFFRDSVGSPFFYLSSPFTRLKNHCTLLIIENGWSFYCQNVCIRISSDNQFIAKSVGLSYRIKVTGVDQVESTVNIASLYWLINCHLRAVHHALELVEC